jgi:hypothetical protein
MTTDSLLTDAPFFTALDPDARIKGSRDPLGFELLWTALGRRVVGNLTTVTRSVRQFSTLLFGWHFANQATEGLADRDEQFLPAFLRFEQLAAYVRYDNDRSGRTDIRGMRAVARHMYERGRRQTLSTRSNALILSDQKSYGLYGLFRVAARNSGLLEADDETRLTPKAREHIESQLQAAKVTSAIQEEIVRIIGNRNGKDNATIDLEDDPCVKPLARLLRLELSDAEKQFYGAYLVRGEHLLQPLPSQLRLWEYIEKVNTSSRCRWDEEFSMTDLRLCIAEAEKSQDAELAAKLDRIRRAEELLGAAAMLYDFLLEQNKQPLDKVSREMAKKFGEGLTWLNVADLKPVFGQSCERLERLSVFLKQADYASACRELVDQNAAVMRERGGSAWIVLNDDKLDVRFLDEGADLPALKVIRQPWVHSYFLNALKRVGGCVYCGQSGGDEDAGE